MLDGLLGRGYSAKCRSLIKQTKSRIDVIRRKRNATLKFLKKDIADLLANGLDINAYGRAEGLVAEIILSSCYDFVEKSCDIVLNQLSVMQKVRECPEECREAASCLMFAAARFSDLPELRDLRQLFQDRYANVLEVYVNQTFIDNLSSKPSSLEKRVQLMKDIAIEFSIEWDCKAFEQRMSTPPGFLKDCKTNFSAAKRHDRPNNGHGFESSREAFGSKRDDKDFPPRPEVPRKGYKPPNGSDESIPKMINYDYTFQEGQEYTTKTKNDVRKVELSGSSYEKRVQNPDGSFKMHDSAMEDATLQKEREQSFYKKSYAVPNHDEIGAKSAVCKPSKVTNHDDRHEAGKVIGKVHEDRKPWLKPLHYDDRHDADKLMGNVHQDRTPRLSPFHYDDGHDADKLMGKVHEDRTPRLSPSKVNNHDVGKAIRKVHEDGIPRMKSLDHDYRPDAYKLMGKVHRDRTPRLSSFHHGDGHDADKLTGKVHEDRTPRLNPFRNVAVPPPYVKPSSEPKDSVTGANVILSHVNINIGRESVPKIPAVHNRDAAASPSEDSGIDHSNKEKQNNGHVRRSRRKHEKDFCNPVDATVFPLPKPRSMRRRHSRSRSGQDAVDNSVEESEIVTRTSRSRRKDDSRRGLQILFDDEQHKDDAEERMIDKLLIHYSKKPSQKDAAKGKGKAKSRHAHPVAGTSTGEPAGGGRRDRQDEMSEVVSPPARSVSLPREHSGAFETPKVYARAASFQADRTTEARHVHPKLPDYDNLAAQFAALRGG